MAATERRYDLDWIRIIGMGFVFTHHVMMYFNPWPWHAKSLVTTQAFVPWSLAALIWIMPLFFVISGMATHHALVRRSPGQFLTERLLRLGVPVLVAIFLLAPFQVYSERVTYGQFEGGFAAFIPRFFEGWYGLTPDGNFAWMGLHAWYLLFLLIFAVVTLPFVLRAREGGGPLSRLLHAAGPLGLLLLTPTLLLVLEGALFGLGIDIGLSGWPLGIYLAFYVLGYSLVPTELFRGAVKRFGPIALVGAVATALPVILIPEPADFGVALAAWQAAKLFACWFWILGLFYLGDRYLNRNSGLLGYWTEATMPFYLLHQPVIVGLGFAMRGLELHPALFFPLLYLSALAITVALCHGVVRKIDPLRFLLGMRVGSTMRLSMHG